MVSTRWFDPWGRKVVAEHGGGVLELYETPVGPIPVVHVAGTPEEMGRQYGALVGGRIRTNANRFGRLFSALGMPEEAIKLLLNHAWQRLEPYTPPEYLAEIEAVAQGAREAGVDLSAGDVQRLTAVTNLGIYKFEARVPEFLGEEGAALLARLAERAAPSCTTFAAWGSRTGDGKMLAHRNLDWVCQTGIHADRLITVRRPQRGNATVTMDYAGIVGGLAGMNDKGISLSQVGTFSVSEELDGIPWVLLARRVLEEADCLEDAVHIITGARHTMGLNFLVADGDPDHFGTREFRPRAAAFETNHACCEVFYEDDPKEHAASWTRPDGTTFYYGLPLKEAVMRADTAFGKATRALQASDNGPGEPANDGDPLKGRTYLQYHKPMHDMIRAFETGSEYVYPLRGARVIEKGAPRRIGPDEALTIAATVAHNAERIHEQDWDVMSVVYAPTDLEFWLAYESCDAAGNWKNAPDTGYVHFTLKELLSRHPLSCSCS